MSRSTANLYVGANYQLTFGKHTGKLLGDLIEEDYGYVLYLYNKKILKIEHWIVDKCFDKSVEDWQNSENEAMSYCFGDQFWKE
jgi:hypothetical protein